MLNGDPVRGRCVSNAWRGAAAIELDTLGANG